MRDGRVFLAIQRAKDGLADTLVQQCGLILSASGARSSRAGLLGALGDASP